MSKWTKKKSRRRNDLIDKKYESGLTKSEVEELANLQVAFGDYQDEKFPLPKFATTRLKEIERRLSDE